MREEEEVIDVDRTGEYRVVSIYDCFISSKQISFYSDF